MARGQLEKWRLNFAREGTEVAKKEGALAG